MAKTPIRVGIWGAGRAGYGMHCHEIDRYKDEFEVVAVCDLDMERALNVQKRYPKCAVYTDAEKFLADPNIELVSVATRSPQHADCNIRALKAGKLVLGEKPVAISTFGIDEMKKIMADYPGKLFFRHNRRFESAFNHILEIMHSGILGEVYEIKLCRHNFQFRDDWQTISDCGGGQLNNWGPHLIDHGLRLLESPVESVWSDLKCVAALGDAEDHLKVILRGENRRVIDIEISGGVALPAPVYAIYGTRGSLICEDEQDIRLKYLAPEFKAPPKGAHRENPPLEGGFGGSCAPKWIRKTIMVEPENGYTVSDLYHHLYLAIRENVPFPIRTEEAFEVVRVTELVKKQNPAFPLMKDVF